MARLLEAKAITDLRVNELGLAQRLDVANKKIIIKIQNAAVKIMKKEAPKASGRLRNSIKVFDINNFKTIDGFKSEIAIGATALHSKYVVRKTGKSQGTYVPALGKRIQFGFHPGTKANNFVVRSKPLIIKKAKQIVLEELNMNRVGIKRFIRNG